MFKELLSRLPYYYKEDQIFRIRFDNAFKNILSDVLYLELRYRLGGNLE